MPLFPRPPLRRRRDGTFDVTLGDDERAVLADVSAQVRELLTNGSDAPLARRLYPTAHPDDPAAQDEWSALMHDQLLLSRFAALDTFDASLRAERLDPTQAEAWLTSINAIRLVLGTRLDVSEDMTVDADDPDIGLYALYEFLGWLLSFLVDALAGSLPPPTDT